MRLRQNDLTWQAMGEEVVVLDLTGAVYLRVNGSGKVLWDALEHGATEAQLVDRLVATYGIDVQQASSDVTAFVADLRARNLVDE